MRTCSICNTQFTPRYNTLQRVCSIDCSREYVRLQRETEYRKETRKRKKKIQSEDRRLQLALTQKSFNKLRRLQEIKWFKDRGLDPECISCGKTDMDWCCGHYKTVGSRGDLRFDPKNTYLQCNFYCNQNLSGNIDGTKTTRGFKQGLKDRFGEKEGNQIIDYLSTVQDKEWSCEELIVMRKRFNAEIRELEGCAK